MAQGMTNGIKVKPIKIVWWRFGEDVLPMDVIVKNIWLGITSFIHRVKMFLRPAVKLVCKPFVVWREWVTRIKVKNRIGYYCYDVSWRFLYFAMFMLWANWCWDASGIIPYILFTFLAVMHLFPMFNVKVFKCYNEYLSSALGAEQLVNRKLDIKLRSWREIRHYLSGRTWSKSSVGESKVLGFIELGVDMTQKVIVYNDRIMVGTVSLVSSSTINYNNGMICRVVGNDIVSYKIVVDPESIFIMSFFGWLVYEFYFWKNVSKVKTIFDTLSARLYGEDIYRKLIVTKEPEPVPNGNGRVYGKLGTSGAYGYSGPNGSGYFPNQPAGNAPTMTVGGNRAFHKGFATQLVEAPIKIIGNSTMTITPGQILWSVDELTNGKMKKVGIVVDDSTIAVNETVYNSPGNWVLRDQAGHTIGNFNNHEFTLI